MDDVGAVPVTQIRIPPWITWVPDAENIVLFDGRDESYHVLNWSASHIWRLLDPSANRDEVATKLAAEQGLTHGDAMESLDLFLRPALAKGLLVVE